MCNEHKPSPSTHTQKVTIALILGGAFVLGVNDSTHGIGGAFMVVFGLILFFATTKD